VILNDIIKLLNAEILCGSNTESLDIQVAKASDLMSDVLRFSGPGKLLITGLTNNHTIRTCNIAGISAIIYVRGKTPSGETIELGEKNGITLLATRLSMFETCGILYAHGIEGVQIGQENP
jgi:hypothetical protein